MKTRKCFYLIGLLTLQIQISQNAHASELIPIRVGNITIFVPAISSEPYTETTDFTYDEHGRLTDVEGNEKLTEYEYDDAGNRKQVTTKNN